MDMLLNLLCCSIEERNSRNSELLVEINFLLYFKATFLNLKGLSKQQHPRHLINLFISRSSCPLPQISQRIVRMRNNVFEHDFDVTMCMKLCKLFVLINIHACMNAFVLELRGSCVGKHAHYLACRQNMSYLQNRHGDHK